MQQVAIHTPQNVDLNFTIADLGKRSMAKIIDLIIILLIAYMMYRLYSNTVVYRLPFDDYWSQVAFQQLFFLPLYTYSLWIEIILHGQSLGKLVMNLQIMRLDGRAYSWENALIRWICNIIDSLPAAYIVALISIGSTKNGQRIGDLAAGTVVVSKNKNVDINQTILIHLKDGYKPTYSQVIRLSDNDMRIIKDTFESALKNGDTAIIRKLRDKIETVIEVKNTEMNDVNFVRLVMRDFNYFTNK